MEQPLCFGDPRLANLSREPELPWWIGEIGVNRMPLSSSHLPSEAYFRGWQLVDVTGRGAYSREIGPVILYDKYGFILHEWPPGYMPSLGELEDVCQELVKGQRGT
jgi:hypothetical protein